MLTLTLVLLAQSPNVSDIEARVKAALEGSLKDRPKFAGMTAAFGLPDGTLGQVALGKSDRDRGIDMKPEDRMLAGSIGKTFFAALALQLAEEGKLDVEAKVSTYLRSKDWFKRVPNHEAITIRHLMTHTSGIPEHVAEKDVVEKLFADPDKRWKPQDIAPLLFDRKPLFEAGKGWSYADANYIVLGLAMESVLGPEASCYSEIERRFLKPLKLADTQPSISRFLPGLVQGYSGPGSPFLPEGPVLKDGKLAFSPSFEWAGGGFLSSSGDLAKWAWNLWGGKVLKPETLAKMVDGVPAKTGPQDKYGLGAMIEPTSVGVSHGHEGWYPGYLSQTMYLPEHKIAVAVQFNTDDQRGIGHRTRWFCDVVAKAVLDRP